MLDNIEALALNSDFHCGLRDDRIPWLRELGEAVVQWLGLGSEV